MNCFQPTSSQSKSRMSQKRTNSKTAEISPSVETDDPLYLKEPHRITKEGLFMILALWIQDFPTNKDPYESDEDREHHKSVGAVLVSPDDIVKAVECTRDGVHGIARLLYNHLDILQPGSKVFVSRKPCAFCTKLLVQSGKVEKVFYLPFEPEYYRGESDFKAETSEFKAETQQVDALFKASPIGQSLFWPEVGEAVLKDFDEREEKKRGAPITDGKKEEVTKKRDELFDRYYHEDWMDEVKDGLPCPHFDDIKKSFSQDFQKAMGWIARIMILSEKADSFKEWPSEVETTNVTFQPVAQRPLQRKQAVHLLTMAEFLAQRTDDPRTGVGAIITNQDMEIKGLGWNGFALKAVYGQFPRASKRDRSGHKKYSFIIHAEQNALHFRNDKNVEGGILFVTKMPCNECAPLLKMQKIKTVILNDETEPSQPKEADAKGLSYEKFPEMVRIKGVFVCFEREKKTTLTDVSHQAAKPSLND